MGTCPTKSHSNMTVLQNLSEPEITAIQESIIVALHNYPSTGQTELTMHIGDRLSVTSHSRLSLCIIPSSTVLSIKPEGHKTEYIRNSDGDFMMVKSLTTECESYIPASYTAKVTDRWLYTGICRFKAVELLMLPENINGSFLIRESVTNKDCYSLSLLRRRPKSDLDTVQHYLISHLPNGWVFISPGLTFPSLMHLIDHYTEKADGLCCRLTKPCYIGGMDKIRPSPMVIRRPTINWKNISRSAIFGNKKIESRNSLVSEGLREAISSYLQMTEGDDLSWDT